MTDVGPSDAGADGTTTASVSTGEPARDAGTAPTAGTWSASGTSGRGDDERQRQSLGSFFRELPVLVIVAFLLAFLLRTFVVQVFYIPSSSMEPTLLVNDRILVDKVSYRFRGIERGEIVVFEGDNGGVPAEPTNPVTRVLRGLGQLIGLAPANARDYVKRVIGLPGDTVEIRDGEVTVNGVALPEPYAVEDVGDCGPIIVPEGALFFLGDNRPNSADSRAPGGLGWVAQERVVGRAFLVIWPFDRAQLLRDPAYPDVPAGEQPPQRPADLAPIQGLCEPAA